MSDSSKSPDSTAPHAPPVFERERTMTPPEAWDTRPKAAPSHPVDPFADIPRIPRAPRTASDVGERATELRDTDHDEVTPPRAKEDTLDMVLKRLGELDAKVADSIVGSQRCYDLLLVIQSEHREHRRSERKRRVALARRVTALELSRQWVPAVAWLVTTVLCLFALIRTYR